jgi:hypothetical protein
MKLSNTWFALILIASALLLSAARSANDEPSSQQHAKKIEEPSREYVASGDPVATPINQSAAEKGNGRSGGETYNYNGNFNYTPPPSPPESDWAVAGEIASVASAVLVAVFTALLWHVSRQQKELMKTAEETSRRSVTIASLALNAERPWIAFEVTKLQGTKSIVDRIKKLHPTLREPADSLIIEILQISVEYRVNNCGRTPARLVAGDIQFVCANRDSLNPQQPPYRPTKTPESLLPPGQSAINSLTVRLFPPMFEKFVRGRESLIVFGFIQYRDVIAEDGPLHESRFRMECDFPGYDPAGGEFTLAGPFYFAFAGPDSYNRYT